jgi:hypothetical protein
LDVDDLQIISATIVPKEQDLGDSNVHLWDIIMLRKILADEPIYSLFLYG